MERHFTRDYSEVLASAVVNDRHVREAFFNRLARGELEAGTWDLAHRTFDRLTELAGDARTDPLTGLPNQRAFERQWELTVGMANRQQRHVDLVYMDIEGLSDHNRRFTQAGGDEMLRTFARALQETARHTDFVGRLSEGGDEFVAILDHDPTPGEHVFIQRLKERLADPDYYASGEPINFHVGEGAYFAASNQEATGFKVDHPNDTRRAALNRLAIAKRSNS